MPIPTIADLDRTIDLTKDGPLTRALAKHIEETERNVPNIDKWNVIFHWLGGTIHLTDANWALLCEEQGWPEPRKQLGALGATLRRGHKGTVTVSTLYSPRHADKATHLESSFYRGDRTGPRVGVTCIPTCLYHLAV